MDPNTRVTSVGMKRSITTMKQNELREKFKALITPRLTEGINKINSMSPSPEEFARSLQDPSTLKKWVNISEQLTALEETDALLKKLLYYSDNIYLRFGENSDEVLKRLLAIPNRQMLEEYKNICKHYNYGLSGPKDHVLQLLEAYKEPIWKRNSMSDNVCFHLFSGVVAVVIVSTLF